MQIPVVTQWVYFLISTLPVSLMIGINMSTGHGGGTGSASPAFAPSYNFSDARNSQYVFTLPIF
jgi:hypothetical protein